MIMRACMFQLCAAVTWLQISTATLNQHAITIVPYTTLDLAGMPTCTQERSCLKEHRCF